MLSGLRSRPTNRFEWEVHLGLLLIVLVLLALSGWSNVALYRARTAQRGHVEQRLRRAALDASRTITGRNALVLSDEESVRLRSAYDIDLIHLFPLRPSSSGREQWLATVQRNWPNPAWLPYREALAEAPYGEITPAFGRRYVYLQPLGGERAGSLLLMVSREPVLSVLDQATSRLFWAHCGALLVIALAYWLVARFVFGPYRRLRKEAERAGRKVNQGPNEAESMVEEYRQIISELRGKEDELRRLNESIRHRADSLEEYNDHLLRSISTGILTVDRAGLLVSLNDAALLILGVDPERFRGQHFFELLHGNVTVVDALSRALECNRGFPYREIEFILPDGRTLHMGISVSVVVNSQACAIGATLLFNDLTELVNLRRELETRTRLASMGEMAAGLAHQLRNSLGAILGYGRLLERKLQRAEIDPSGATALSDEAREAEALINKFLEFARPSNFEPAPVDLIEMCRDVVATTGMRREFRDHQFICQAPDEVAIMADALLLKQAIVNLVENAAHAYDDAAGGVELRVVSTAEQATIAVIDQGNGIPADIRDEIFTPFYSTRASGTGLGLALVKKIVDLHGGRIKIDSAPGQGTTVSLSLPLHAHEPAPQETVARQ